jgi:UDP-N-acetylglucosamine--N-acetylmuramyl-(pentapeptide) pyrophosphoryl-undecaprenol N-acetylglucosamine transferase
VILVPSPNVAEDHQTKNAMALVEKGAALLVKDKDASQELMPLALDLINQDEKCKDLSRSVSALARPLATEHIVDEIERIARP